MRALQSRLLSYNRNLSSLDTNAFLLRPCFGESYLLYADIASVFLSDDEVTKDVCDLVEDFKQLHIECFYRVSSAKCSSRYGCSNSLNLLVVFLYFYFFDLRYGGITQSDKPKYEYALKAYLKLSKSASLHSVDKATVKDFDGKHLEKIRRGLKRLESLAG